MSLAVCVASTWSAGINSGLQMARLMAVSAIPNAKSIISQGCLAHAAGENCCCRLSKSGAVDAQIAPPPGGIRRETGILRDGILEGGQFTRVGCINFG